LKIDEISWDELTHAYGSAEDVPDLIRNLTTTDSESFEETIDELFENIWHQGTVYEATVYALPFLIDILRDGKVIDNCYVATLVASIVSGKGYYQVHSKVETINQPENLEELLDKENEVVIKIKEISLGAVDLLMSFLTHESSEVRRSIAEAFGCFPSQSLKLLPILRARLECEEDEEVMEQLEESIAKYTDC